MFKKMVVTFALSAALMGLAGGPVLAGTVEPEAPPAALEMVEKAGHKMPPELKEFLQKFREELKQEREKTRAIAGELRQDREKLRQLVKEAGQKGEKEKLELLKPLKVEAKAIADATKELREQKKQAWSDLKEAIKNRNVERARVLSLKILELKKLINHNLSQLDGVLDRAVAILD